MVGEAPEPARQSNVLANESMENIFEQNLRQLSTVEVYISGKYKIDLFDNLNEDDIEEPQDLDEDEKIIKIYQKYLIGISVNKELIII